MVKVHSILRLKRLSAIEALSTKFIPNVVSQFPATGLMAVPKLRTFAEQFGEEELQRPSPRTIFLHLRGRPLWIVRRIYFKLLAETTLKLVSIFELDTLFRVDVRKLSEPSMGAWPAMLSLAMV